MQTDRQFFDWVRANAATDTATLRLKYAGVDGPVDYPSAIVQIECRRKFARKLAQTLAGCPDFYFPSALAGEQSTSDIVAAFHASLVAGDLPMCDLTAGLGIDALHAAERASSIVAVERDADKAEALRYNADALDIHNLEVVCDDCRDFVECCVAENRRFATVFIDPARRAADGSRVFALSDCEPDVVSMMPHLSKICDILIIKASPMLDITHTVNELQPSPQFVMAVGTATECKELLAVVNFASASVGKTVIEAVSLGACDRGAEIFAFTEEQEKNAPAPKIEESLAAGDYIYEASPELMKTGAFRLVAERFGFSIFHPNTRLFTSKERVSGFQGNICRVVEVLPYASKVIKRFAGKYPLISVATRNFGLSADALRAKLGVRDGANSLRLYGISGAKGERLLVVTEVEK